MAAPRGLLERLRAGDELICAEGYIFEFERRGYLKAGAFVPEVVLEHPNLVRTLHEEFVHAGSDVVEAFTYYAHRAKLGVINREEDVEKMNRQALRIARDVANETGTLMAGNICNTTVFDPDDVSTFEQTKSIFKNGQSKKERIISSVRHLEAKLALECIQQYGNGLPAVVTLIPIAQTFEGVKIGEACRLLEEAGAAVVGLNCFAGPDTILPPIREVRKSYKGPIACLPVPFRTDESHKYMITLVDPKTGQKAFPCDLNAWLCSRSHVEELTRELKKIGVQYMGLCCGNQAHYTRAMAETIGRSPPASKYSPDMTKHLSRREDKPNQYAMKTWQNLFE